MEDSASIFGLLPVPKKRRTVGRKPRTWNPEVSEADREDEAVSALLQLLKEEKGDSEKPEDALLGQKGERRGTELALEGSSKKRVVQPGLYRSRGDWEGAPDGGVAEGRAVLDAGQRDEIDQNGPSTPAFFSGGVFGPGSVLDRDLTVGPSSQDRPEAPALERPYKRCASHVYIAHFIEYHTNKNRMQQVQQRHANGFGSQFGHSGDAELPERASAANGTFHKPNAPAVADSTANVLPTGNPQDLPLASAAHQFLGPPQFPGPVSGQGHSSGLQGLPPSYAHLLSQQPGAFPFLPPALHMGGFPQQAVQALANFPGVFNSHMMAFPGGLPLQQLGTAMGSTPPNGSIPLPSLSLPATIKAEAGPPPPKLPHHTNGSAIKQEDSTAALLKLGLSPAAIAGVDLDRLRAMLPPDFFQPRGPLVDGVKPPGPRGEKPSQMEAWAAKMQTHM